MGMVGKRYWRKPPESICVGRDGPTPQWRPFMFREVLSLHRQCRSIIVCTAVTLRYGLYAAAHLQSLTQGHTAPCSLCDVRCVV